MPLLLTVEDGQHLSYFGSVWDAILSDLSNCHFLMRVQRCFCSCHCEADAFVNSLGSFEPFRKQ